MRRDGTWYNTALRTISEAWLQGRITVLYGETCCTVQVTSVRIGSGSWDSSNWGKTIEEAYRPQYEMSAPLMVSNGASHTGFLMISGAGVVSVKNMGSSGSGDTRNGSVTWAVR